MTKRTNLPVFAVYPRWRGEHFSALYPPDIKAGLSPLARGTRHTDSERLPMGRFIPAGAGNTPIASSQISGSSVYPRWRGEHCPHGDCPVIFGGLSPLARGTLIRPVIARAGDRFIPAGAGNTAATGRSAALPAVYPRWRGEHFVSSPISQWLHGLSPLARGTH